MKKRASGTRRKPLFRGCSDRLARQNTADLRQTEQNRRRDHRRDHLRQHVRPVVAQGVKPRAADPRRAERDELLEVRENHSARNQVADKAQEHGETRADADADIALIAENARKADDGEGEDIIKQKRADQHRRRKAPAQNAVHRDAERKLNDRLDERGGKTPFQAEHNGDHRARQHGKQRDRTAERHLHNLHEAEYRAQRDHDGAHGELVGIAGFLHFIFPQNIVFRKGDFCAGKKRAPRFGARKNTTVVFPYVGIIRIRLQVQAATPISADSIVSSLLCFYHNTARPFCQAEISRNSAQKGKRRAGRHFFKIRRCSPPRALFDGAQEKYSYRPAPQGFPERRALSAAAAVLLYRRPNGRIRA